MIDFQFIKTKKIPLKNSKNWLKKVVNNEKKQLGEIVYVFCNDSYILQKNIQFLNHNFLTDVISFDYSSENTISGDVLISIERIKDNAKKFNVPFLNELDRVMVHGLLHLLGYNDKSKNEIKTMRDKENFYLSIK